MGQHGDRVREALLDSAEELFAGHGVDAVSNRQIAEHAGNANHSAVSYHFGGRDKLIRALMERNADQARARRKELADVLGDEPNLRDLLICLIVPWTDQLGSLPSPSWRARLLLQLRTVPSQLESVSGLIDPLVDQLLDQTRRVLSDLPEQVLLGRSWIVGRMVTDVCAQYETRIQHEAVEPDWTGLAYFLIDAAIGMLTAPVTSEADFVETRSAGLLP